MSIDEEALELAKQLWIRDHSSVYISAEEQWNSVSFNEKLSLYEAAKVSSQGIKNAPKGADQPVGISTVIYRALNGHKMVHQKIRDTDMALPLVDYLTPEGWTTIDGGMEENEAIADTVAEVIAPYLKRESGGLNHTKELIRLLKRYKSVRNGWVGIPDSSHLTRDLVDKMLQLFAAIDKEADVVISQIEDQEGE